LSVFTILIPQGVSVSVIALFNCDASGVSLIAIAVLVKFPENDVGILIVIGGF
jgi:hypothetical protein